VLINFVFIGMVFAEDADEGVNAKVYYFLLSGGDGKFSIGKTDGKIKALESLDREEQENYALLIKATNDPEYSAARVILLF
jgi:Cadherin domain